MFFRLAAKNVRQSIRDYLVYFLTLVLAVCIFYMFNSVDAQMVMLDLAEGSGTASNIVSTVIGFLTFVMAFVMAFLIIYANGFIMKRRRREFGLYMTLGISNRTIAGMLAVETLLIGVMALAVGLALGYFASQGMSILTAHIFRVSAVNYHFVFSESAFILTCIYFAVIFIAVMVLNVITVSRQSLAKLMLSGRENQKIPTRRRSTSLLLTAVGIVVIGLSYWTVFKLGYGAFLEILLPAIGINFVGTLLFLSGLAGLTLSGRHHSGKYYTGLTMFTSRQLASRVTTNVASMAFICSMLFLTIVIVSSTGSMQSIIFEDGERQTPFDVSITTWAEDPANNISVREAMEQTGVPDELFEDAYTFPIYVSSVTQGDLCEKPVSYDDETWSRISGETLNAIALSDYNEICRLQGADPITLANGTFAVDSVFGAATDAMASYISDPHPIQVGSTELSYSGLPISDVYLWTTSTASMPMTLIVPDSVAATLAPPSLDVFVANYAQNTADPDGTLDAVSEKFSVFGDEHGIALRMALKADVVNYSRMNDAMMTFVGLYIGMVFLVASAAVLALQMLSATADDRPRYELLRKLGTEYSMIDSALLSQVTVYFLLPLGLAAIHSVAGLTYMAGLLGAVGFGSIGTGAMMTALLICGIYGVYFLFTYLTCRSMVHAKETRRTE